MSSLSVNDVNMFLELLGQQQIKPMMFFIDPPFNVGKDYGTGKSNDKRDMEDYQSWCSDWLADCFRLLDDRGTIYFKTITRHLHWLYPVMSRLGVFINQVNWYNVTPCQSKRRYVESVEPILVYGKTDKYKFNPYAQKSTDDVKRWGSYKTEPKNRIKDLWQDISKVYSGSITHPEAILVTGTNKKLHPTQMPIALPERCILHSTDVDDVVVDPFCGLGATGIACVRHHRNYYVNDINEEYIRIAQSLCNSEIYKRQP
jgi:site-specific DNA-methyltransferase (adenine-specific)